jgi:protein-S-isoprenylcysteine O-methyltransferase Ste14
MSSLTFWSLLSALVVLVLFAANAVVYRQRFGTFLRKSARPHRSAALPRAEVALYLALALALLVGVATPEVFPDSSLAQWLGEPYAKVVYYLWCFVGTVIVGVVISVVSAREGGGRG